MDSDVVSSTAPAVVVSESTPLMLRPPTLGCGAWLDRSFVAAEPLRLQPVLGKRPRALGGSDPQRIASTLKDSRPGWAMLDCYIRCLRGDDYSSRPTLAYESTSTGDLIGVGFWAAVPPGTSRLLFDWFPNANNKGQGFRFRRERDGRKDPLSWSSEAAKAVATHRNSILLRFRIPSIAGSGFKDDFFVYRPHTMTLTRLAACGHASMNFRAANNMGILYREDAAGEFAVAHLSVTRKEGASLLCGSCPVTAKLCWMLSQDGSWRAECLPTHHGEGQGEELLWWETDVVVPFGDCICWVDYLRGILFCDVFSPTPELQYVPLPVYPYKGDGHPEGGGRGVPPAFRSVCMTKDGVLKFVDAAASDLWFCGSPNQYACDRTPSSVTSWTLSSDRLTWTLDGSIEFEKFFALSRILDLPCVRPTFPLVDIEDPQTIYFALKGGSSSVALLVAANMSRKMLGCPTTCATRSSLSGGGSDWYKTSCNLYHGEPFLPYEYLGPDASHTWDKKTIG